MHDWNAEVARNLKDIGLSAQEQQETISELGDYLQDRYEQALAEGMSDAKAVSYCLAEAGEWGQLGRKIRDAKHKDGAMNYRTKALWVPGLASFAAASILLMLLQRIVSLQPKVLWRDGGAIVLHPLWWLLLPVCGAVGAYLSRRAGGRRFTSLVAGLFPAIVMLTVFCAPRR